MPKVNLDEPELYLNRELSWLEFNDRVLREGLSPDVPLLERLKFLAIVSSNLDEFYMIRVAGLLQQQAARLRRRDPSGRTAAQQLEAIARRVHQMVKEQTDGILTALAEMRAAGLALVERGEWTAEQARFLRDHFSAEVLPILTPLAVQALEPAPLLHGLQLHVAALIRAPGAAPPWQVIVVPQPGQLSRFVPVPGPGAAFARLDDVIAQNLDLLFPGLEIEGTGLFRLTRDGDVPIEGDEGEDLLQNVEEAVRERRRRSVVRLEIGPGAEPRIVQWLRTWLSVPAGAVFHHAGMLDATALLELAARPGLDHLRYPDWPPQPSRDLLHVEDIWSAIQERDALLIHPYERFEEVVRLLEQAADDRAVVAIKQTLYRTSGESPIVRALETAARNGKQVTVLVELKARFDEARNVAWARRLEDAGCQVLYGIAGLKTHAKALLIIRREPGRIRRYVHLSTGNYNDRTARLYSDLGLLSSEPDLARDVAAFFNLLTGASEAVGWSSVTIAPTDLRRRFVELIERESRAATRDQPGLILAKVNSLQDPAICEALYRASEAGVRIRLNVRGICCLRPGVSGVSETIEVRSIVDRFLEHARIFYFANGGHEEVYLSSADWMTRNLDRRLELLFPVTAPALIRRLAGILETYFSDNTKAWRLRSDGSYERVPVEGPPVRAQARLYAEAVEAARAGAVTTRFRPLTRPAP